MIARRAMVAIRRAIDRKVRVEFVCYGSLKTEEGFLKCVVNRSSVELKGGLSIPFVGCRTAIRRIIAVRDDRVIYDNPLVSVNYNADAQVDVEKMRALTWGTKKK